MRHGDNPFERMTQLFEQMNRSMYGDSAWALPETRDATGESGMRAHRSGSGFDANVSVDRTDEGFAVMADLPGFEKDELAIRFEDGILTIRGDSEIAEDTEYTSHRRSRQVFEQLRLPESVVEDDITASYHNGVLEITLPIEADATEDGHRIDIE